MSFKDKFQQQVELEKLESEKKKAEEDKKARERGKISQKQQMELMSFTKDNLLPLLYEVSDTLYQKRHRIEISLCSGTELGRQFSFLRIYLLSGNVKKDTAMDSFTKEPFKIDAYESFKFILYSDKICIWHSLHLIQVELRGNWKGNVEDAILRVVKSKKMYWNSSTNLSFVLAGEDETPFAKRSKGDFDFYRSVEMGGFVKKAKN